MVESIIEAASELLDAKPGQVSTNHIAQRAGASIGSVYHYFPNKEAITAAVYLHSGSSLLTKLKVASQIMDWQTALRAMIEVVIKHQLDRPVLARYLDAYESSDASPETVHNFRRQIEALLSSVIQRSATAVHDTNTYADLVCITQALCDSPSSGDDGYHRTLGERIERAVFGYLGIVVKRE